MKDIVHKAQENKSSYLDFLLQVLDKEVMSREKKDYEHWLNAAHLPSRHNLDEFAFHFSQKITPARMK